jgi:hypothetical protein
MGPTLYRQTLLESLRSYVALARALSGIPEMQAARAHWIERARAVVLEITLERVLRAVAGAAGAEDMENTT